MTTQPTVADALCAALERCGVTVLFGHPGGAILPVYDALARAGRLRHVLVRHEQSAAHAADGYARASGRPGVCIATSGPGATNLVTGLAAAMMDGVPVVAITGQVPTFGRGLDFFQETDVIGLTMPVTKHGFSLDHPKDVWRVVDEAFALATRGRPGPVLIDIPKDVQTAESPPEPPAPHHANGRARTPGPSTATIELAARLVNDAARPLVMVGRGAVLAGVTAELLDLVERTQLPIITTLLGLDALPPAHPCALGMPGMHGTERANRAIQRADVILGLGLRFDDRVTGRANAFAPDATIIHADIAPEVVGKTIRPGLELIGDLATTLPLLAARLASHDRAAWWDVLRQWPKECDSQSDAVVGAGPITGRNACRALARLVGRSGAIVVTDVGQHQMWLAQELRDTTPRSHLTSGGLGAMGYALPAGIGAALARPDRPVWIVAGDGGFQMTAQELAAAVQERVPVRIAVINNGFLGMVRQWQELCYDGRYSAVELPGPNFAQLARAYGIPARTVRNEAALDAALEWAGAAQGPVLLDLNVAREDNVFPMVPPGAALDEMWVEHPGVPA